MNNAKIVAVLMSVYGSDSPQRFERAVRSVLNQKLSSPVRVRIYLGVDGPLPFELEFTVCKLAIHFYKVVRSGQARGLVHVLNDLVRCREDEELLFRMDSDDVSHPDRFERQMQFMERHPEVDILGTDIVEVQGNPPGKRIVHFADNHDHARRNIAWRVPVAHPTVCFRARVFDRIPGYPAVLMNEDISMWFECLKAGMRFHNLPEPLYEFTIGENFWKRRGLRKSWLEFRTYAAGLWQLEGLTWKMSLPMARLIFRLAPVSIQQFAYGNKLRAPRSRKLAYSE